MTTEASPFSMGSSTAVPALGLGAAQGVDMSLDELIQARRNATNASAPTSQTRKPKGEKNRRTSLKSKGELGSKRNAADLQKTVGKARRNAKTAARRGLATTNNNNNNNGNNNNNDNYNDPTSIERGMYRQQRAGGGNGNNIGSRTRSNNQPRRSNRINRGSFRTDAERKVKAKNLANDRKKQNKREQTTTTTTTTTTIAPTKKAFSAAMKAMSTAGFTAPKGMKMVISFAPKNNTKSKPNANANANNKKKSNTNTRNQQRRR